MSTSAPDELEVDENATRQPDIIACSLITFVAAAFFVALRLYTRIRISRTAGWDDWLASMALFLSAAMTGNMLWSVSCGLGLPPSKVDLTKLRDLRLAGFLFLYAYMFGLYTTKISILFLYRRILSRHKFFMFTYIVLGGVAVCFVFSIIVPLIMVSPIRASWEVDPELLAKAVHRPTALVHAVSGLHLATDIIILILPLPMIFGLTIGKRERIILIGIFSLGFIVPIASIMRLYYSVQATGTTWNTTYAVYLTCIELNVAIICCCMVTLKPLISQVFPKFFLSLTKSSRANSYGRTRTTTTDPPGNTNHTSSRRPAYPWSVAQAGDSGDDLILDDLSKHGNTQSRVPAVGSGVSKHGGVDGSTTSATGSL